MSLDTQTPPGAILDELRDQLLALPEDERRVRVATFTPAQLRLLQLALGRVYLDAHQRPPPGDWDTWLMLTGRGVGKTVAGAHWMDSHMMGKACDTDIVGGHRAAIIGPTHNDAWESVTGPRSLTTQNPEITTKVEEGATYLVWPNGARARIFGVNTPRDIDRLRAGGNRCAVWCEELAAWPKLQEAWSQIDLGLRIGAHPKRICTTTPRPKPLIKRLLSLEGKGVVVTRAKTADATHLDAGVRERLHEAFAGTRLGRQELGGEVLDDHPGALWTYDLVDRHRCNGTPPDFTRVVVGVDPAGSVAEDASSTGIVVAARGKDGHGYVLADRTIKALPAVWGRKVGDAYDDFTADKIVAERNFGGDTVDFTIRAFRPDLPVKMVSASRGKQMRAEPVSMLYDRGMVHHVGVHAYLEDQMCSWDPDDGDAPSPDRLDALVWALTELMVMGAKYDPASVSPGGVTSPSYWRSNA